MANLIRTLRAIPNLKSRLLAFEARQLQMMAEIRLSRKSLTSTAGRLEATELELGRILAQQQEEKSSKDLKDYEFKIFSQWGEDGILQHLVREIPIAHKTFIEFGVEDFSESNCRFLMMKDNWRGFVIDGSDENITRLKQSPYYWKHDLTGKCAFITRSNIDSLLRESGFDSDLGILSVDIDGVDYWVFEAIDNFRPRILILEYNAVFGSDRPITVPYSDDFVRTDRHHTNLYCGASLPALAHLAGLKGYALVGTNSAGNNAFFVRNDLVSDRVPATTVEQAFQPSIFRESRDENGQLTFVSGIDRLELIRGLPAVDVTTGESVTV